MKAIGAWFGAHPLRPALAALCLILMFGAGAASSGPARADRDWYPYLGRDVQVELTGAHFSVSPVSDWTYLTSGETQMNYSAARFDLADLRGVWFMLEPQPGSTLAAHTLLLFEFEGDRLLGLTIEARREAHENYSALAGLWNAYELAYIWGSARDFLTRRVVMLRHEVFVYPVAISREQQIVLLSRLIERTDALERHPRYYNTLFSNCTNELAKAADLDWSPAFILTGTSDEHLYDRGVIPGESFEAAHARSNVTDFVRALNEAPAHLFDAALLAELRRRNRE